MRVLLIEDDSQAASGIELVLQRQDICVDSTDQGEDGLDMIRHFDYDLIVLDLGLPDMSGLEVLRKLRKAQIGKPVLILSGDASMASKVGALNAGADDFLTKPFHGDELVARISSLVRRSRGLSKSVIAIGAVTLDLAAKTVEAAGQVVALTDKEYQILELLSLRRGVTLSRETFINHLYLDGEGPESNTISLFVHKLRKKLAAANGGDGMIETVRDRGYLLRCAA